ncbi:hypothetical protein [Streptomyces sp. NPDC002187]|uniref:hypothetical protein n=1 Tax=Streptomyces sp. NPDC002187 TaxID=3364637 RepID=UPI00368C728B
MGTSEPEKRHGDGPEISDEEWARFVREAEAGGGAPKEPSARARMVTERLRAQDQAAARRERRRWGRKAKPAGQQERRRTGPAWQETNGRAGKRRNVTSLVVVLALVGVAVVAVRPELVTDHLPDGGASDVAPLAQETARPTAAPSRDAFPDRPTLKDPFRGSPAVRWADGAAGIVPPEAKAVGGMSKEQVAHALRSTEKVLVAANLDPATLRGERPEEALELLDPLQESGRGRLEKALREPGERQDPLVMFSRFDPGHVRLVGDVVKTRGRMTFGKGDRSGEVRVHADYTFVYPLVKAEPGSTDVARSVVRRHLTFVLYDPAKVVSTQGKLNVLKWESSVGNSACGRDAGFYRPQFTEDLVGEPAPSGPAVDPYDRSRDLADMPQECGTVTRT